MDLCSRKIVGWEFGSSMTEDLVLGALRRAIRERLPGAGLIHHTDCGGQYAGKRYREVLRRAEMPQSMIAAETCYDNAFMESCFGPVSFLRVEDRAGTGRVRPRLRGGAGAGGVHPLWSDRVPSGRQRRAPSFRAGVRLPGRVRTSPRRPEIRECTVRAN